MIIPIMEHPLSVLTVAGMTLMLRAVCDMLPTGMSPSRTCDVVRGSIELMLTVALFHMKKTLQPDLK